MPDYVGGQFSVVEIVTRTYVVEGRCGGLTPYQRLVDMLNNPDVSHLQILNPKVRGLGGSNETMIPEGYLFLDKDRVVFASTIETPQEVETRRRTNAADRVEKDRHNVLVLAAPFRIMGTAFVVKGADPNLALPKLFNSFLAITDAKVVHENDESLVWDKEFLVVNGQTIEMISSLSLQAWQALRRRGAAAA